VPDAAGIYSGNLLNWATTSKYDLLQDILVGGISTSRQTNVNTLISKSNSWQKSHTYFDSVGKSRTCIFDVNNSNMEVTELTPGACGYLDGLLIPRRMIRRTRYRMTLVLMWMWHLSGLTSGSQ
jgi:hypothetical protein